MSAECHHGAIYLSDKGVRCWDCRAWFPISGRPNGPVDFQHRGDRRFIIYEGMVRTPSAAVKPCKAAEWSWHKQIEFVEIYCGQHWAYQMIMAGPPWLRRNFSKND